MEAATPPLACLLATLRRPTRFFERFARLRRRSNPRSLRHEQTLTTAQIKKALETLPDWKSSRDALEAEFTFRDFRQALAFMVRVGFEAEALNHHPEWTNVYNRVLIRLNTHEAAGKVTAKDVDLARRIEKIRG